ncbi:MAG: hypothetical protein ABIW84_06945 [Ilumatobacteraceae bacterium]
MIIPPPFLWPAAGALVIALHGLTAHSGRFEQGERYGVGGGSGLAATS